MSVHISVRHSGRDLAGVARPDESYVAAARRIAATVHGEPVARDLSGETKHFDVDHDLQVVLRPMTHGDLPLMTQWRQSPHIRPWFLADGDPSPERVARQYTPDIDGRTPKRLWVAEGNGRSVGFVQDYRISDYPQFALLTPDPDAVGLDYAVGDELAVGKGLGTRMLWVWLLKARRRFPEVTSYFAAPDHRNTASLRVLEKVGFTQGVWFDEPQKDGSTATVVGCTLDVARVIG